MTTQTDRLRAELDHLGLDYDADRIDWTFDEEPRDPEGKEVEQWVKCAASVIHFINNYCFIQDPIYGRVPMLLYPFQKTVLKQFLRNVFNICLKPRQMGLSWLIALFALWYALFRRDKTVVVISIK